MQKQREKFLMKLTKKKDDSCVTMPRIIMSIMIIVMCLCGMSFSAFAYFSCSISSKWSTVQSAGYSVDIISVGFNVVQPNADGTYTLQYNAMAEESFVQTLDTDDAQVEESNGSNKEEAKVFVFEITRDADATAQIGYCKIEIVTDQFFYDEDGNEISQVYYTRPIGIVDGTEQGCTVSIVVPEHETAIVKFVAEWGTYSGLSEMSLEEMLIEPIYNEKNNPIVTPTPSPIPEEEEGEDSTPEEEEGEDSSSEEGEGEDSTSDEEQGEDSSSEGEPNVSPTPSPEGEQGEGSSAETEQGEGASSDGEQSESLNAETEQSVSSTPEDTSSQTLEDTPSPMQEEAVSLAQEETPTSTPTTEPVVSGENADSE